MCIVQSTRALGLETACCDSILSSPKTHMCIQFPLCSIIKGKSNPTLVFRGTALGRWLGLDVELPYIKKKQKIFLYKELHTSVCKSITHNMPKVEQLKNPEVDVEA